MNNTWKIQNGPAACRVVSRGRKEKNVRSFLLYLHNIIALDHEQPMNYGFLGAFYMGRNEVIMGNSMVEKTTRHYTGSFQGGEKKNVRLFKLLLNSIIAPEGEQQMNF